jgi:hypothetical protein
VSGPKTQDDLPPLPEWDDPDPLESWGAPDPLDDWTPVAPPPGIPDLIQTDVRSPHRWSADVQGAFFAELSRVGLDYATLCLWCRAYGLTRPSSATAAERAEYLANYEAIHAWAREWRGDIARDVEAALRSLQGLESRRRTVGVGAAKLLAKRIKRAGQTDTEILASLTIGELADLGRELIKAEAALRDRPDAPPPATGDDLAADLADMPADPLAGLE